MHKSHKQQNFVRKTLQKLYVYLNKAIMEEESKSCSCCNNGLSVLLFNC